jgi:EAL domain-containing protein (putative c-di-GMP-specific phosphodiesterase class I)
MDDVPIPLRIDQPRHEHFSEIKLGHALIAKLEPDSETAKSFASTVSTAHHHGMVACATGLETIEQLDRARAAGIDLGQGSIFAENLSADETLAWVEREEKLRSFKHVAPRRQRVG